MRRAAALISCDFFSRLNSVPYRRSDGFGCRRIKPQLVQFRIPSFLRDLFPDPVLASTVEPLADSVRLAMPLLEVEPSNSCIQHEEHRLDDESVVGCFPKWIARLNGHKRLEPPPQLVLGRMSFDLAGDKRILRGKIALKKRVHTQATRTFG